MNYSENIVARLATPKHIVLFSEDSQRVIYSDYAESIHEHLSERTDNPYIEDSPECYYSVDHLLDRLLSVEGATTATKQKTPTIKLPTNYDWGISLINAELRLEDNDSLLKFSKKHNIKCFLVDDFMACALRSFLNQFDRYILIKPFGHFPSVSPIIGSDASCYQCFYDRLLHNQPIRKWWLKNREEEISIPTVVLPGQKVSSFITNLNEPESDSLTIYSSEYQYVSSHRLNSDSECPSCGNSALFLEQLESPIKLNSVRKNGYRDGGFRTEDPDITLNILERLIDPVLGYITDINSRDGISSDKNKIYFSSFYTQPYYKDDFKQERFIYTTMGKGISHAQSKISALSEAVERIASQYHGNEFKIKARQSELDYRSISLQELTPFSATQYAQFKQKLAEDSHDLIHQCEPYNNEPIYWTKAWSLVDSEPAYLPLNFCYSNTPYRDGFTNFFHNGGSAGNCLEEAVLQGVFELIERDAVAIWWYNRICCPSVDYSSVSEELQLQIESQLSDEYDVWVLDLTQDIPVPVMCAMAWHRESQQFILGFGCHLDGVIACQRALTELFQLIEIKDNNTSPFCFSMISPEAYLLGNKDNERTLKISDIHSEDIKDDIEFCLRAIKGLGLNVYAINNTRAALKLSSVKVMIPGFCHMFPYLGLDRLYSVPVKTGFLDKERLEEELNPLELLI